MIELFGKIAVGILALLGLWAMQFLAFELIDLGRHRLGSNISIVEPPPASGVAP